MFLVVIIIWDFLIVSHWLKTSVGHDIVGMSTFHSLIRHRGHHDGCCMRVRKCLPFRSNWSHLYFHRGSCCLVICVSLVHVIVLSFWFWVLGVLLFDCLLSIFFIPCTFRRANRQDDYMWCFQNHTGFIWLIDNLGIFLQLLLYIFLSFLSYKASNSSPGTVPKLLTVMFKWIKHLRCIGTLFISITQSLLQNHLHKVDFIFYRVSCDVKQTNRWSCIIR